MSKPEWIDYSDKHVIKVFIDFPRDKKKVPKKFVKQNRRLQTESDVKGYHTYIILDSEAKDILGELSADRRASPSRFINQVEAVIKLSKTYVYRHAKTLSSSQNKEFLALYEKYQKSLEKFNHWIETRPKRNEKNTKIYNNFREDIEAMEKKLYNYY